MIPFVLPSELAHNRTLGITDPTCHTFNWDHHWETVELQVSREECRGAFKHCSLLCLPDHDVRLEIFIISHSLGGNAAEAKRQLDRLQPTLPMHEYLICYSHTKHSSDQRALWSDSRSDLRSNLKHLMLLTSRRNAFCADDFHIAKTFVAKPGSWFTSSPIHFPFDHSSISRCSDGGANLLMLILWRRLWTALLVSTIRIVLLPPIKMTPSKTKFTWAVELFLSAGIVTRPLIAFMTSTEPE